MTIPQIIGVVALCVVAYLAGRYAGPWGKNCAQCAELEKEVAKARALLFECSTLLSQVMLTLLDELDK